LLLVWVLLVWVLLVWVLLVWVLLVWVWVFERALVVVQLGEDGVQALVALLCLSAVPLDPLRHQIEHLRLEMAGPPLGVAALGDEAGVGEHLDVLGDGLHGDVVGLGELADGGVANGEAGHDVAPRRIGEGGEDSGQLVVDHGMLLLQPIS
jgi:hypothetical protein